MIEYRVKVYKNGNKFWYLNGKLHRKDAPACEYVNGSKEWYLNGKLHREDGPACEYVNGNKYWYLNGKSYSEQEFLRRTNPNPPELQIIEDLRAVAEKYGYKLTKEGE